MNKFKYKARDKKGGVISGEVEASSAHNAAVLLRERGYVVVSVSPVRQGISELIRKMRSRVSSGDVTTFTRQMSTMVGAGLPITDTLVILRSQAMGAMQKVVARVLADVEGGSSLSAAFKKHPKVFSPTYVALVEAGETGGVLDDVLKRLADNMENQQEFKGKVKGAMIYPAVVIVGMLFVAFIMMVFVIPKLVSLYEDFDAELPMMTKVLMFMSESAVTFWPIVIAVVGVAVYGFVSYRRTSMGRRKTDEMILKIPIVGDLQRQVILTEFSRTLSLLSGAGVSILEGLKVVSGVVGNRVVSDAIDDAAKKVEKGFPLAYSLAQHQEAFPFILTQMIAVGEETGKMSDVLAKVAHVFEVESEQKVKALTAAVEPLIMMVLGIGVAFLVMAIILPIYNLTSAF